MVLRGVSWILVIFAIVVVLLAPVSPAVAGPTTDIRAASQIIHSNALLKSIFEIDPKRATALAAEARRILSDASKGNEIGRAPSLKYRGGPQADPPSTEGEILSKNRKDFKENPILREIYFHSPLASLRMLKRLREATKKN